MVPAHELVNYKGGWLLAAFPDEPAATWPSAGSFSRREWMPVEGNVSLASQLHFSVAARSGSFATSRSLPLRIYLCKEFLILPSSHLSITYLLSLRGVLLRSLFAYERLPQPLSHLPLPSIAKKLSCSLLLHPECRLPMPCHCLRYVHSKLPSSSLLRFLYAPK